MAHRQTADLPLHSGAAPAWLFRRMVGMAGAVAALVVRDGGPHELLRRLSDPCWFQAFGCVLGFDWHSSGLTTTVCAALKEAARTKGADLGVVVCGGKGATGRKTPEDVRRACDRTGDNLAPLLYASRMAAKVDGAAVQDGYGLYHHCLVFAPGGAWCVVQQGLNPRTRYARRYHWLSEALPAFVRDPHAAVACDYKGETLNLVAGEAERHREAVAALAREHPDRVLRELRPLRRPVQPTLFDDIFPSDASAARRADLRLPARHSLTVADLDPAAVRKVLLTTYERQAADFEQLLGEPGLGPAALRSLSLLAELIYNAPASRRDPAAYSFAHGGKDGHPYRVDRVAYDASLGRLQEAVRRARIGQTDREQALRALAAFVARLERGAGDRPRDDG